MIAAEKALATTRVHKGNDLSDVTKVNLVLAET